MLVFPNTWSKTKQFRLTVWWKLVTHKQIVHLLLNLFVAYINFNMTYYNCIWNIQDLASLLVVLLTLTTFLLICHPLVLFGFKFLSFNVLYKILLLLIFETYTIERGKKYHSLDVIRKHVHSNPTSNMARIFLPRMWPCLTHTKAKLHYWFKVCIYIYMYIYIYIICLLWVKWNYCMNNI